ncbi:MAG: MoxR family ATPase [Syntrophobacterales bacterium]|nr:MoxR family ATPase [Syntrophobacterales bacterium]
MFNLISQKLSNYLHGKELALRLSLICLFSRGHLLIEDLPGLGKTTLALGIAKVLGLDLGRIQCTNDLLPSDVTGLSVYDHETSVFKFHPGPVFHNIVLVDEINRASPKTQSALLEAMGEKQVTVDGKSHPLPQPFFVIATQNPAETSGVFPLPDSQLDRFAMRIQIGYPNREAERQILMGGSRRKEIYSLEPITNAEEILEVQRIIRHDIYVSDAVMEYILDIVEATRKNPFLKVGLSTRGALALINAAKADAYLRGRDYLSPDNVKFVAPYVISHRVEFSQEYARESAIKKQEVIRSILNGISAPVM